MTIDVSRAVTLASKSLLEKVRDAIAEPSDRIVLMTLFVSLFCVHYVIPLSLSALVGGEPPVARTAGLIGFAAVAMVLKNLGADRVLRWWDFVAIALLAIALIPPWPAIGALVLTGLGVLYIVRSDRRLASLGQLCIGLAWISLWGPLTLSFIEPWLLPFETALAFLPLSLFGSFSVVGNVILGENGHSLEVLSVCSAFSNTIKTAFIWLSLVKIHGLEFRLWNIRVLAVSLAAVVLLNTIRLALMAHSYSEFVFWHNGSGATIVQFAMLVAMLGPFYIGLRRAQSHTV